MRRSCIDFVEKNIHGAWVVWGEIGIRQYYYYTKAQAKELYKEECKTKGIIVNKEK
jgi:hypothetical protein